MNKVIPILLVLLLTACATGAPLATAPSDIYSHISMGVCPLAGADASATQLTDSIAVSAKHVLQYPGMISQDDLINTSDDMDLLYYRHTGKAPEMGKTFVGEHLTFYGASCGLGNRVADGNITAVKYVTCIDDDHCTSIGDQIVVRAPAGEGFSGGPAIDDQGRLVGMFIGNIKGLRDANGNDVQNGDAVIIPIQSIMRELPKNEKATEETHWGFWPLLLIILL